MQNKRHAIEEELFSILDTEDNIRPKDRVNQAKAAIQKIKNFVSTSEEKSPSLEAKNMYGRSFLAVAAGKGDLEIVQELIAAGAKIDSLNSADGTPLMSAAVGGNEKIVQVLIDAGANVKHVNNWGGTALYFAVLKGHYSVAEILLKNKADPNACVHGVSLLVQVNVGNLPEQEKEKFKNLLKQYGAAEDQRIKNSDLIAHSQFKPALDVGNGKGEEKRAEVRPG